MNALMTQASIIHDERSWEASAMAAARQQGGDGFFTSIFLFVCVLFSLALTTKTKLSALISLLIDRMHKKARFCNFSVCHRKITENVPKHWRVKSFLNFLCLFHWFFFKKRLFGRQCG
jgi:hypothetical protein